MTASAGRPPGLLAAALTIGVFCAVVSGCDRPARRPQAANGINWKPCRLPHLSQPARCTTVALPENYASPAGTQLDIHVAVIDAIAPDKPADPLFFIAGGPGQAASAVVHGVLPALSRIRRKRDLVFVDVRGTGRSGALDCAEFDGTNDLRDAFSSEWDLKLVGACAAKYRNRDLGGYRTDAIVADLEAIAGKLGYQAVNVYGISYGTRVALRWMEKHPSRIRASILDGVAPPQMTLFQDFAADAQASLDTLARDCLEDSACSRRFGDVRTTLDGLLTKLGTHPDNVTIAHPRTGSPTRLGVTAAGVAMAVRGLLYSPEIQALLPLALADAATGDYATLATLTLTLNDGAADTTSYGLLLEIACSEDVERLRPVKLADSATPTFLRNVVIDQVQRACRAWFAGRPDPSTAGTQEPPDACPKVDVPTLLLSGALDPVTPPRWADTCAQQLTNAQALTVPSAAHGTYATDCVPELMAAFIADPAGTNARKVCHPRLTRPPFFLHAAGYAP